MKALIILITSIFIQYCESCYCLKCSANPPHKLQYDFKHETKCANSISKENTESKGCSSNCYTVFTIMYNRDEAIHHIKTNGNLSIFRYTVIRGCSNYFPTKECSLKYLPISGLNESMDENREILCPVSSESNNGNSIDITQITQRQATKIIEICASCEVPYSDHECLAEQSFGIVCTGGLCYIRITFDINKNINFRRGCLIDFHTNIKAIEPEELSSYPSIIYPTADKNIESWGICEASLSVICNKIKINYDESAKVDKTIMDKALDVYKNLKSWNHCLYCYANTIDSLCTKGKIRFPLTDVIVCHGSCILMLNVYYGNDSKNTYEIVRSCNDKRDKEGGKIGGLNPIIEEITNQHKSLGCFPINNNKRTCRTECNEKEQLKIFCNKWQLDTLLLNMSHAIDSLKYRANASYAIRNYYDSITNKTMDDINKTIEISTTETYLTNMTLNDIFQADHDIRSEVEELEEHAQQLFIVKDKKVIRKKNKKSNTYLYYGFGVAILVIIVILLYLGKKIKEPEMHNEVPEEYKKAPSYISVSSYTKLN